MHSCSPYHNIITTYYDTAGSATNALTFGGWAQYLGGAGGADPYGLGRVLQDSQVSAVVSQTLDAGALPKDPNAMYLVIMPPDATYSGFCYLSCGCEYLVWVSSVLT